MSYATMQDVLLALDVDHSELRDRRRRHADVPEAEPELPEERGESQPSPRQRGTCATPRSASHRQPDRTKLDFDLILKRALPRRGRRHALPPSDRRPGGSVFGAVRPIQGRVGRHIRLLRPPRGAAGNDDSL